MHLAMTLELVTQSLHDEWLVIDAKYTWSPAAPLRKFHDVYSIG